MREVAIDGWRLALGTLTVLPTRPPRGVDDRVAGCAALLAPAAFLPVAAAVALIGWLADQFAPAPVAALLMVAALTWATRAIHLDGLADTVDGLGSARPPSEALALMRKGDIGPMGVTALILVIGLQVAAVTALVDRPWGAAAAAVAWVAGRGALVIAARRGIPAARPDGLGAAFAGTVGRTAVWGVWLVLALALVLVAAATGGWWRGVLAAILASLSAVLVTRMACRRLGGVTGDVFGAAVELAATVALVALALA